VSLASGPCELIRTVFSVMFSMFKSFIGGTLTCEGSILLSFFSFFPKLLSIECLRILEVKRKLILGTRGVNVGSSFNIYVSQLAFLFYLIDLKTQDRDFSDDTLILGKNQVVCKRLEMIGNYDGA
jgi:hypothetical protein